jgi:hypothetical protein
LHLPPLGGWNVPAHRFIGLTLDAKLGRRFRGYLNLAQRAVMIAVTEQQNRRWIVE